ncbi:MAG TPA: class I mannose-6-phosphate isomerase [Candidatus Nanopelagicaceae bacterium]|nr:class I mannose-6-phosphate isomerase [Candidatus Nanopelagicaceae bacterium]
MRPEEWIGSTTTRFGMDLQGLSHLPDGTLLIDNISRDPIGWLGLEHFESFGESTELLVKLLDPDQRLPVHFHPNKSFSRAHLSLAHGKTEGWIILEAPPGAKVGLGFAQSMTRSQVLGLVKHRDSTALLAALNFIEVKRGDTVFVPAGLPHAIGKDIFILELQEPTDLSVLLEWDGFAVDGEKDGHLGLGFETALEALTLSPLNELSRRNLISSVNLSGTKKTPFFPSVADGYFCADLIPGNGTSMAASFSILLVIEGEGVLSTENSGSVAVSKGDALVYPFASGSYKIRGAHAIACRPPRPTDSAEAL